METIGSFLDEEWESLSQIFSNGDQNHHDFLLQQYCHGGEIPSSPSFLPSHQTNFSSLSQESSNTTEIEEALFLNIHEDQHHHHNFDNTNTIFESMNTFHNMDFNNAANLMLQPDDHATMEDFLRSKGENRPLETADSSQIKRKSEAAEDEEKAVQNPKKKPRFSRNTQKNKTVQSKKGKKTLQDKNGDDNDEEIINGGGNRQSCSSYSSEDDSNASQELNEEIKNTNTNTNTNTKARTSRGSATDPQSLYARKRRERINERLKILQNLVPNGTKVDISTMLEEAVQYVKFLQLQIKLLSSDNLWMYAPLAYNGMDIGMYQKICPNLRQ